MHIATQKASVGMYSGCDYPYKSLQILFVYFLTLLSLLHPSILFNCFCTCFFFFIALGVIHQCHLIWFAHSTPTIEEVPKFARAKFVAMPLTFLCLTIDNRGGRIIYSLTKKLPWDWTLRFGEKILSIVGSLSYHLSYYLCHWGTELADCWGAMPETADP